MQQKLDQLRTSFPFINLATEVVKAYCGNSLI